MKCRVELRHRKENEENYIMRHFIICTSSSKVLKPRQGGVGYVPCRGRNAYNILIKYLMGVSHLEDTEAQGRIILKYTLKKQVVEC
jgi:hypothetical protein